MAKASAGDERMPSGPKVAQVRLVAAPPPVPPGVTDRAVIAAYKVLRAAFMLGAERSASHTEALVQGARLAVRVAKLAAAVVELESEVVCPPKGAPYIHPLVRQLGLAEASYRASLGALVLTPKAALAARLSAGERVAAPVETGPPKTGRAKKEADKREARVLKMSEVRGVRPFAG